jgi:hypothetical protein
MQKKTLMGRGYLPPDKNGKLDPGGFSYGSYQIETQKGTMRDFMNYLKGSDPTSYATLQSAGGMRRPNRVSQSSLVHGKTLREIQGSMSNSITSWIRANFSLHTTMQRRS